jgi:nucleotidyltransferase substrate binding protein (TIGR01987 family)
VPRGKEEAFFNGLLEAAIAALERSLAVAAQSLPEAEPALAETIRAGVIQHFEVAFEQCWKFMQRWLDTNGGDAGELPRSRKDLFRQAARVGLIPDALPWFALTETRNLTTHTYDLSKAEQGFHAAHHLLPLAQAFLKKMRAANA